MVPKWVFVLGHFKCNKYRIQDKPNLFNYLRELYQIPEIKATVNFVHIKVCRYSSYFWCGIFDVYFWCVYFDGYLEGMYDKIFDDCVFLMCVLWCDVDVFLLVFDVFCDVYFFDVFLCVLLICVFLIGTSKVICDEIFEMCFWCVLVVESIASVNAFHLCG